MAHKTLIDGTAYDVKGGRCLVDGTGYTIQKGRTKVGGTGYDVTFTSPVSVSTLGSGNASGCYAVINGTVYSSTAGGMEVMPGDVIKLCVSGFSETYYGEVSINYLSVLVVDGAYTGTYSWTVPDGISKIQINFSYSTIRKVGTINAITS